MDILLTCREDYIFETSHYLIMKLPRAVVIITLTAVLASRKKKVARTSKRRSQQIQRNQQIAYIFGVRCYQQRKKGTIDDTDPTPPILL